MNSGLPVRSRNVKKVLDRMNVDTETMWEPVEERESEEEGLL